MPPDRVLLDDPLALLTLERDGAIVRFRRTSTPITPEGLDALEPRLGAALPPSLRASRGLLFDARDAPLLGDEAREKLIVDRTAKLLAGFPRTVVLVRTAVGRLQASRFSQRNMDTARVIDDEAAAIAHLLDASA